MPTLPEYWDDVACAWEMACPGCASGQYLDIEAKVYVRLVEDGTDVDATGAPKGHEWFDESECQCGSCGWSGTVADAKKFYADNDITEEARSGEGIEPERLESGGQGEKSNQI